MHMENENENFDELQQLLALKKHEQPPPGYFNKLPGEVISRLRAERRSHADALGKLSAEAPWLVRLWQKLEAQPVFAGAFGAGVCALLLAGIYFAEKPDSPPDFAGAANLQPNTPLVAATAAQAEGKHGLYEPLLVAATNTTEAPVQSLFDLYKPGQAMPASARGQ